MAEPTRRIRIPLNRVWGNFFGRRINVGFISLAYYFYSQEQRNSFSNSSSYHTVLAFVVPLLLNFLQLKYQGRELSPFETHPKSMAVAIASLLLYCFAYDAELRLSSSHCSSTTYDACINVPACVSVLFGSLFLVSLTSILFPDSLGPVLYFLYILFSAGELLHCSFQTNIGAIPPMHQEIPHSSDH